MSGGAHIQAMAEIAPARSARWISTRRKLETSLSRDTLNLRLIQGLLSKRQNSEQNDPGESHGVPEPGAGVYRNLPRFDALQVP